MRRDPGSRLSAIRIPRAVSSAVEHLVYTERVGGSKPSPPTSLAAWARPPRGAGGGPRLAAHNQPFNPKPRLLGWVAPPKAPRGTPPAHVNGRGLPLLAVASGQ